MSTARPTYDLYATWGPGARLLAVGPQAHCERTARRLLARGIATSTRRVGRVTVVDLGPLERAADLGEAPYHRAA